MPRLTPAEYLARLRRIARARGGRLLSRRYLGDRTKLWWRCAERHVFRQAPTQVKQGKWCRACGIARRSGARKARARLYQIVAQRGGLVLSPEYVNSQTKMRFRCARGHEWEAVPNSVVRGMWCRPCRIAERLQPGGRPWGKTPQKARQVRLRVERMVRRRGGRILAPGFISFGVPIRVRCGRGHTWTTRPASISNGAWCRECRDDARMDRLRELAERRGGKCLAESCRSMSQALWWQCALGHRFESSGETVGRGSWCPTCRGKRRGDIRRMRRIARERGGACLSKRYVDSGTKLRWRCREGHVWNAKPTQIVRGSWCPVCGRRSRRGPSRLTIEDMRRVAAERRGWCLSDAFRGIDVRLRWRCARGHTWMALPSHVRRGTWCPACAQSVVGTIEGIRALAASRGGRCLSRTWDDHTLPLHFECARGHRFQLLGAAVRTGVWCPRCKPPSPSRW